MAQTMHLALFGPIFVAATPPIMYFIDYNYIYYKPQLESKKEEKKKKKKKKKTKVTKSRAMKHNDHVKKTQFD